VVYFLRRLRRSIAVAFCVVAACAARERVVVDTDCGLFGDDGAALVMLLRNPAKVEVAGITLTSGNVWAAQSAGYVLRILDLLKKQVPVYSGAELPLVHTPAMARESERRWGKLEFTGAFAETPVSIETASRKVRSGAVEFLISEIERHPGSVSILAIGPMTNIALALRMKPGIESKIKQIVFMGGNVRLPGNASRAAEFNFWFDPEAASIVLRSRVPRKVMFALDICSRAPIRKREFDQVVAAGTPITDLFREDLGNRYPGFLHHPEGIAYLWDSLAAAWLLDPEFVTKFEMRKLDVLTNWGRFYGATVPLDSRVAPDATAVTFMSDLNFPRVFALYKEQLTRRD
jgi:inosine-uridine nucleoside N-ribohydrolase